MRVLLHTCCGPCTIYPLQKLRKNGHEITAYFFNPNIHPFREFKRRLTALKEYANTTNLHLISEEEYNVQDFLRAVVFKELERCRICYDLRLEKVFTFAKNRGYQGVTSTLLYSKYQNHEHIKRRCKELAQMNDLDFLYSDFRKGWQEGVDESISLNLYRQPYCGCIYSEQERYDKNFRKKRVGE